MGVLDIVIILLILAWLGGFSLGFRHFSRLTCALLRLAGPFVL